MFGYLFSINQRDTPAFTVDQEAGGMDVLYERAAEVGAILSVVPDLSLYPGPLPGNSKPFEH